MDTLTRDFLVKDFEHWCEAYFRNEEAGERRVQFFIGIVTAVLAGIGFLAKQGERINLDGVQAIGCAAIVALVALGLMTLLRLVRRNGATDGYLNAMTTIRYALGPTEIADACMSNLPKGRSLWSGGLTQIVALFNAALAGLGMWLLLFSRTETKWAIGSAVLTAIVLGVFELRFVSGWLRSDGKQRRTPGRVVVPNTFRPNAGLVVVDDHGRVLALERRDTPGVWQFPQGGIEPGEAAQDAAWRELLEETGLSKSDVDLVHATDGWLSYELPPEARSFKTGRGQTQKWFLFRLRESSAKVRIVLGDEASHVDWRELQRVVAEAVAFRRPVYEAVAREFAGTIGICL